MVTTTAIGATAESPALERYRAAERELWAHYGLKPQERFVESASPAVRLRVNEVGSGPPVLFVHGLLGTGPYWGPLVRELSGVRCLMVDRPGYGLSSAIDWSRHDMGRTVAQALSATLDEFGIDRVDVVGGSIGGVLALHLAKHSPERVRRVVMLGGGPLVREFPVPGVFRVMASPLGVIIERLGRRPQVMRQIIASGGHAASLAEGRIPPAVVSWRATLQRDTPSIRNERAGLRAIIGSDGWRPAIALKDADLGAIPHPTLLLQGTADPTAPLDLWTSVMERLPHGEMRLVEGGGHQPWLDDPAGVAREVTAFLARA
jgi:pimeloyl-ACP methyl ester carboxylesterase